MRRRSEAPSPAARFGIALSSLYLVFLLILVLFPIPYAVQPPLDVGVSNSPGWLADALRNLLLFAPVGAGLSLAGLAVLPATAIGFALSVAIELTQIAIPGRFAAILDVATNTLSCAGGATLVATASSWLAPAPQLARRLSWLATSCATATLLLCTWLLGPALTTSTWYGGWTLDLGDLAHYQGRILEARIGETPIGAYGPAPDSEALRRELRNDAPLFVRAIAGPPPRYIAPLVTIHDQDQRENLLIGAEESDVIFRWRTRAAAIGLDNPRFRQLGALSGVAAGDPLTLRVSVSAPMRWVSVDGGPELPLAWSPGRLWALFAAFSDYSRTLELALDFCWTALLILPACYWAGREIRCWLGIGIFVACMAILPRFAPLQSAGLAEWLGLGLAVMGGPWLAVHIAERSQSAGAKENQPGLA